MIRTRIRAQERPCPLGRSYEEAYLNFKWEPIHRQFSWHGTGRHNIAFEAVDRWAADPAMAARPALIHDQAGEVTSWTFAQLKDESCRWANMLANLGLQPGGRLVSLLPPRPTQHLALLAAARLGAVFCGLSPDLTPHELHWLVARLDPKVIITTPGLARRLPPGTLDPQATLVLTGGRPSGRHGREELLGDLLAGQSSERNPLWLEPGHPLYIVFTSGGDGPPKGVIHCHGDMPGLLLTGRNVLDLGPGKLCWTDGLSGWPTSIVYGGLAPWLCGAAALSVGEDFGAHAWYRVLERHRPTTWYTRPTVIMLLKQAGEDLAKRYDLSGLGHVASVGRPLSPQLFFWFRNALDRHVHDTWWSAEMGMIALANFPGLDIKLGSAGLPVPGVSPAVVDGAGQTLPLLTLGELAFRRDWPSMPTGLWGEAGREDSLERQGWYLSGDLAFTDEDGYYYLSGRKDDVLRVQGRLLGPYEVERALARHPAVAECAAILPPSEGARWFKGYVVPRAGHKPTWELEEVLKALARADISPYLPLREIEFLSELPRNARRRLLRRVLKARELGLPIGDIRNLGEDWAVDAGKGAEG